MNRNILAALLLLLCPAMLPAVAEESAEEVVSALWQALSHEAGDAPDVDGLRRVFHGEAMIYGSRYREGEPVFKATPVSEFLQGMERKRETAFHECEISRKTLRFDRLATVFSVVESRRDREAAEADFVGVNGIQLQRVGSEWKIISLHYHVPATGKVTGVEGVEAMEGGSCGD